MLAADKKPVEILNELIIINDNRIHGYNFVSEKTDIGVFKILFYRLTETSTQCRMELENEVYKLGGKPANKIRPLKLSRSWEKIKSYLVSKDHFKLLTSCNYREKLVIKSYENLINNEEQNITSQHLNLFSKQYRLLSDDRLKVKNLLNVLINTN